MLYSIIRETRLKLGMSQVRLAQLSGVSLPYIQRLESGRANPSAETLSALGRILGFEIKLEVMPANWDALSLHGAPLLSRSHSNEHRPSVKGLLSALGAACLELDSGVNIPDRDRKLVATQALCWAIQTEFPTFFKKHFGRSPLVKRFLPEKPKGELIKLRRIAASTLAGYL
jgi:transcriptional regulator with XRE-family HTH domain